MALFALWHEAVADEPAAAIHARLLAEAHIVPQRQLARCIRTPAGAWHVAAFATATAFYSAEAQLWEAEDGGLCLIHGLIWRPDGASARLIDAAAMAALLDRPARALPHDIAGEFAVARLHPCGTLELFGDPAGLHQIFHREDGGAVVANRAGLVAAIAGERVAAREAGLWLTAIGYRAGPASGWDGVLQLPQGARATAAGPTLRIDAAPLPLPPTRGFAAGGEALLEAGLAQAKAAVSLAAGNAALDLPITGGKDSRVVLAIALAAGMKDRLTLFTRGYAGHPDVLAGEAIAASIGVPHRREPPLGSDTPADLAPADFLRLLGTIAYQADGGMGGWDNVTGATTGKISLLTGHMGELLKAYSKRPLGDGPLDPVAMVRLQAPFDPMALLRGPAHDALVGRLATQMAQAREAGAEEADLPDLFYWSNRIPNWLGGIRGIKSFERQPVMPLGVPALLKLAFLMTAAERKAELAHYRLIERAAPELLPLPFAHQSWSAALPNAPQTAPLLAAADAPLFGSWQWSLNRNPAVRARLSGLFRAVDVPLWEDVDRARLLAALRERRFDYFDAISLMGLATAFLHQSGLVVARKLDGPEPAGWGRSGEAPADAAIAARADDPPVRMAGHVDRVEGGTAGEGRLCLTGETELRIHGWLQAPDWPGASVAVTALADGAAVATVAAATHRPDLEAAGIGDGRYGFTLAVPTSALGGANELTLTGAGGDGAGPEDGRFTIG